MASDQIRMGLAVRQVDAELARANARYPDELPATHISALLGWEPRLRTVAGMQAVYTTQELLGLTALQMQLEVNRCHAEAMLAVSRSGQRRLFDDEKELLVQRAVGVLPADEASRYLEIASSHEHSPHFLTSSPERLVKGIVEVEAEMGMHTALGYGFLLMAGVRAVEDLKKYGDRVQQLFDAVTGKAGIVTSLSTMGESGLQSLSHDVRARIVRSVRDGLWQQNASRVGRSFLLTQVIDGYLGLRPGGIGDDLGLAVADAIVMGKLGFPVGLLLIRDGVYLEIPVSAHGSEYWDPLDRTAEVRVATARRLTAVDLLVLGYTRMARGYANAKQFVHGTRVAEWVLGMQPRCAEAYQILGQCLLGEQNPTKAIEMCQKSLMIDRRMPDAYFVLGNAYSMLSRWPEAIEKYKMAIQYRVGYAEAYNNLGLALQRNGELDRAVGAYREAIRVRPDYAEAYYNMGNLHLESAGTKDEGPARSVEYDLAIQAYQQAVAHSPNFAGAYYNLGQACYAKKELAAALAAYQAAVKANPKHAGAWHNMGIVYRDMGRPDLAVEAIEKAVTLNPILLR
jgi:tetratricopeptide (TPR) repeat protein